MHENLKTHPEKAFMLFYKVYIYITNTDKKWNDLTTKQKEKRGFKWGCVKLFVMSNGKITKQDIEKHIETCPEMFQYIDGVNKKKHRFNSSNWNKYSEDYVIYEPHPITEYDAKLLLNTIGVRMLHFINTN